MAESTSRNNELDDEETYRQGDDGNSVHQEDPSEFNVDKSGVDEIDVSANGAGPAVRPLGGSALRSGVRRG